MIDIYLHLDSCHLRYRSFTRYRSFRYRVFADIGVFVPDISIPDIGVTPISEDRYSDIDPDIRLLRYLDSELRYRTFHLRYRVQYRVQYRTTRYRGTVTPISEQHRIQYRTTRYQGTVTPMSGTTSGIISGFPILGYGNSNMGYNIGYNIRYPNIEIPISDTISGVPISEFKRTRARLGLRRSRSSFTEPLRLGPVPCTSVHQSGYPICKMG